MRSAACACPYRVRDEQAKHAIFLQTLHYIIVLWVLLSMAAMLRCACSLAQGCQG